MAWLNHPEPPEHPEQGQRSSPLVERRTVLQGLATGLAGACAVSAIGAAATGESAPPVHPSIQPASTSAATSPPGRLLDELQRQVLASLADLLVPGAVAAGVVEAIDRVTALESPEQQRRLLNALGVFEREARTAKGVRWLDLDEPDRLAILQAASTGPPSRPRPPAWTAGQPIGPAPEGPPPPATLRDEFEYLRTRIADAYFATEAGMREHGWTGRMVWKDLPGCGHAEAEHE